MNPGYDKIHDPFLFKDMKIAVERIWRAIQNNEKILIHGDYDADGVTSAAVLYKTFKILGAKVDVFIPHREDDGYGINSDNLNKFSVQEIKLFITVDCGITNVKEIAQLNKLGIDVIVTDHHEPLAELPAALAILDPKVMDSGYPFRDLAGAGVAFKLVQALISEIGNKKLEIKDKEQGAGAEERNRVIEKKLEMWGGAAGFGKWLLDIVAIGTVADVAPIIDENRVLVKWGLIVLRQTRNLGLQKLLEIIGNKKVDSYTIGYQIAPRLNAAGRMNHASAAFELLVAEDVQEAEKIAQALQENNYARQRAIEAALARVKEKIASSLAEKIFFVYDKDWRPGIIGLVAGKLADEYYRPVIAMTLSKGKIVGSGRSIDGLNITQGLSVVAACLARYGGHAGACGFTLAEGSGLAEFQNGIKAYVENELRGRELTPFIEIDAEINISQITFELLRQLELFAPFGEANARPLFLVKGLQVAAADAIGQEQTHLRLLVKQDSPQLYKMLWFGKANEWLPRLSVGNLVDAVCELGINEWNGNREIEFKIVDLRVRDI